MPDYKGKEGLGLGTNADGSPSGENTEESWMSKAPGYLYGKYKDWMTGGPAYEPEGYGYDEKDIGGARGWDAESRGKQDWLAQIYADRIAGKRPSVAQQQMEVQNAENKRQQIALARSGTGGALGQSGAMRTAQMTAAQQDLGLQRNAGLVRAQEQATAEAGLADLYGQQRGQDQSRLGAEQSYQLGKAGVHGGQQGLEEKAHEDYAARSSGGGIMGGISSLVGAISDRTAKADIEPTTDGDLEDFLEAAKAYWWKYKNGSEADDGGELHVGPMAQDLAKTKVGSAMVDEMPSGKLGVDVDQSYGAFLAGLGELHDRVKRLEGGK